MRRMQQMKPTLYTGTATALHDNTGAGQYAIRLTLTGSYGETLTRFVGGSYACPNKCAAKAHKYYLKGHHDAQVVHLSTGKSVSVHTLLAMGMNLKGENV